MGGKMKVVQIEARDIVLTFEMSLSELEKVKMALDYAELQPLSADLELREQTKEAANFLTEVVYPFIIKSIEMIKEGK
jgi:hypothetical protein